jgi:hypothetical protein
MTRDDVLRLAREAGFEVHDRKQQARVGLDELLGIDSTAKLERFTALVAAAERDACAAVCESWNTAMCDKLAAAIRARGAA